MVAPLPLPPPSVKLTDDIGRPTTHGREFLERLTTLVKEINASVAALQAVANAPAGAQYVTLAAHAGLSGERVLTAGANIGITDGGAGNPVTIAYTGTLGGMTLVGTLATTSGATASITGLAAAKMFVAVLAGVSHNAAGITTRTLQVALSTNNGAGYGTPNVISAAVQSSNALSGVVPIAHVDGTSNFVVGDTVGAITTTLDNTVSGTVNALQFSWSGDSFDAGTIYIYALK